MHEELLGDPDMKTDPILREVYRMKAQLAREIGNDAGKLVALLREAEKEQPCRMVRNRFPKRLSEADDGQQPEKRHNE